MTADLPADRDELAELIADEITGWQVSSGYYGQTVPYDVAREIAEHLCSSVLVGVREDAARAALHQAADDIERARQIGRKRIGAVTEDERAFYVSMPFSTTEGSAVAGWLRARAAGSGT